MLSRRQLYCSGVTRSELRAAFAAGRWTRLGPQTVRVGARQPTEAFWRAILEVGPRAVLDGVSALQAAGLQGVVDHKIHVAVPKSATPRRCAGVKVHETRRYRAEDVLRHSGVPRTRPATAAVHAALWAVSDAQAALFLIAPVQQGIVTVEQLSVELARVRRDPRLSLLHAVLGHIASGVQSTGEQRFAELCDRRRLPRPTRQAVQITPSGRTYVDADFDPYGVSVEIDGVQHLDARAATPDALKQNEAMLRGRIVLRIPVWALETDPDPFLDQLDAALRRGGWPGPSDERPSDPAQ